MGAVKYALPAILLLLLGLLFVIFGALKMNKELPTEKKEILGAVVDAGGSGTRLIVYQYKNDKLEQLTYTECEKEGLTKYKSQQLDDLEAKLKTCFEQGVTNLPKEKQIPIYFAATAGMRLLRLRDETAYNKIWNLIKKVVGESGFQSKRTGTISGFEEAKWAWVAANYLKNSSFADQTFGTIDFGSSSLQITFENNFKKNVSADQRILHLNERDIKVYGHSYLCFGNDEIQRRFLAKLVKNSYYATVLDNPCFFKGFNKTYTSDYLWSEPCCKGNYAKDVLGEELTGPSNTDFMIKGSGNFSQCYSMIDNLIRRICTKADGLCGMLDTFQPRVHGKFLALSTYYHIAQFLNLSPSVGKSEYLENAKNYCSKSFEKVSQSSTVKPKYLFPRCFQAAYSYYLLVDAFKFDASDWNIDYIKKIKGDKVGWSLGMMYSHIDSMYTHLTRTVNKVRNDGYLAMLIVGVFCLLLGILVSVAGCKMKKRSEKISA